MADINREAAIRAIEDKAKGIKNEDTLNGLAGAIAILFDLPSVTQKSNTKYRKEAKRWKTKWLKSQKSGHWIFKHFDEDTGISDSYWCSECNTPLASVYKNYCPNCGARMVEEQE